jgi:hypothetical protein
MRDRMRIQVIGKGGLNRQKEVLSPKWSVLIVDEWWRFDDSKVTSVPESKILSLDGGGEADTAYSTLPSCSRLTLVLLYRAKEFPKRT